MSHTPVVSAHPATQPSAPTQVHDRADPCTMVIFGALGDLIRRKLFPAIYQLMKEHLVDEDFRVLGVGRDDSATDDTFRSAMRKALTDSDEVKGVDEQLWQDLCRRLFFVSADLTQPDGYAAIGKRLEEVEKGRKKESCNRLFYLAVPPSIFESIVKNLSHSGLAPRSRTPEDRPWTRVVIEKPFGRSLENAVERPRPLRRASDVSNRSLSRERDRSECARVAIRELDLRADLEPTVDSPRADHGRGNSRCRRAWKVLRGSWRRSRHVSESLASTRFAHRDGAARADVGQLGARRKGESSEVDSPAGSGFDREERCPRAVHGGQVGGKVSPRLH